MFGFIVGDKMGTNDSAKCDREDDPLANVESDLVLGGGKLEGAKFASSSVGIGIVVGRCENLPSLMIPFQLFVVPSVSFHSSGAGLLGCLNCMQSKLLLLQNGISEQGSVHFKHPFVLLSNCLLLYVKLPINLLK